MNQFKERRKAFVLPNVGAAWYRRTESYTLFRGKRGTYLRVGPSHGIKRGGFRNNRLGGYRRMTMCVQKGERPILSRVEIESIFA